MAEKYAIGTAPKVLARVRDAVAAFSVAEIEFIPDGEWRRRMNVRVLNGAALVLRLTPRRCGRGACDEPRDIYEPGLFRRH